MRRSLNRLGSGALLLTEALTEELDEALTVIVSIASVSAYFFLH